MEKLTKKEFEEKIVGFENSEEWKFSGSKPIIIDFYADWCGPCKRMSSVLEILQKEFEDKIEFFKVDTDNELYLPSMFNIRSIPTLIFFPIGENYLKKVGALQKSELEKIIKDVLKIN